MLLRPRKRAARYPGQIGSDESVGLESFVRRFEVGSHSRFGGGVHPSQVPVKTVEMGARTFLKKGVPKEVSTGGVTVVCDVEAGSLTC